ncbi:MAG: hypothetical protein ACI843_000277 [Psychrobacter glaciei]|jgi:hypothetical protein
MTTFNGTVTAANQPIVEADALLSKKITGINTNNLPIDKAAFTIATRYVSSYKTAIEKYITAVNNKHSLIEQGGKHLAEMQELKTRVEGGGLRSVSGAMKTFLNRHNIKTDRNGGDDDHNAKEWQINIEYLNNWIKGRSNEVETDVIKLNDIINKQNQLLQSTTTILKKAHEVLQSLIRTLV